MKKLTSLGCLLALVFAGASAFADSSWFNVTTFPSITGDGWTVPAETAKWHVENNVAYLNDWDDGAVYRASEGKALDEADSKITTKVTFTAMDPEDLASYSIADAKAGVTLVEVADNSYQFKVIKKVQGENGLVNGWVEAGSPVDGEVLKASLDVTVEIFKSGDNAKVKYTIGTIVVDESVIGAASDMSIQTVEYKGKCEITPDLTGLAWSNVPGTPTVITPTTPTGAGYVYEGPTTVNYDHAKLKALIGDSADDDVEVAAYFGTKQNNGQFGWVNYALGIGADSSGNLRDVMNVASNMNVKGEVALDFGFNVDTQNHKVEYEIGEQGKTTTASLALNDKLNNTDIYSVELYVDDIKVGETKIGVMETGKEIPDNADQKKKVVFDIVAVPWAAFGGAKVTVANVLNTAELTEGDTLYVQHGEQYDTYTLNSDKQWQVVGGKSYTRDGSTADALEAEEAELIVGEAIWLEHDIDSRIIFAGVGETSVQHKWTAKANEWTLIANPTVNDYEILADLGAVGDQIIVEDAAAPLQYVKDESYGWGYWKSVGTGKTIRGVEIMKKEFCTTDNVIKAGIGFWYVNNADSPVEIDFGTNADPVQAN